MSEQYTIMLLKRFSDELQRTASDLLEEHGAAAAAHASALLDTRTAMLRALKPPPKDQTTTE